VKIFEKVKDFAKKISDNILKIFNKEELNGLARETGFIQRSTGRIGGEDFVRLMTAEILGEESVSCEGLCDILRQINPEADMTPQALNGRLNKKESAGYLKEVSGIAMKENLRTVRPDISPSLLSPFGRVFVQDSTVVTLHEKLAGEFRGSGGSASASSLKIDMIYELKQNIIQKIEISGGNVPDQQRAETVTEILRKNDLIIRDLGYFTLNSLKKIGKENAFFLSRLLKGANVYLSADKDAEPVNLPKYLDKKFKSPAVCDINVYLGKEEKLPCRLIACRLPDGTAAERRRRAREKAGKKGGQPSKEYLNRLKFGFFVTNAPEEILKAESAPTLYRVRWQIELTFKHWKSLLSINILKGTRRERIECFLYGRLTAIVILTMICGFASRYAYNCLKKEISFHKVINWLKRKDRLSEAFRSGSLKELLEELLKNISKSLCKQKRKRKTTRQLLEEAVPFTESFPSDETENDDDNNSVLLKE
jgi:hypothetical protein